MPLNAIHHQHQQHSSSRLLLTLFSNTLAYPLAWWVWRVLVAAGAMLRVEWMKTGSRVAKLRDAWKADAPLSREEGGSHGVFVLADFLKFAEQFQNGASMTALGTLHQISNDFSNTNFLFQANQIEKLGRKLWTLGAGGDSALSASAPVSAEVWFKRHPVVFGPSWPAKLELPVCIRDCARDPGKRRLLAMDEVVLAFWKMVDAVLGQIEHLTKRDTPHEAALQALEKQIDAARHFVVLQLHCTLNSKSNAVEALTPCQSRVTCVRGGPSHAWLA